jgi:hypothetical protein
MEPDQIWPSGALCGRSIAALQEPGMRRLVVLVALLMLGGCESDEDFWQPYHVAAGGAHDVMGGARDVLGNAWPFGGAPPYDAANAQYANAFCASVADQRVADASANGYDDDMQDIVHAGTYADCMEWNKAHPRPLEIQTEN